MRIVFRLFFLCCLLAACLVLAGTPAARADDAPVQSVDLSTPRRALNFFLDAGGQGAYQRAGYVLDIPRRLAAASPAELARELLTVLDQDVAMDPEQVSDAVTASPVDGDVGTVSAGGVAIPLRMAQIKKDGRLIWAFTPATVARIPFLYAQTGHGWVDSHLPAPFFIPVFGLALWKWLWLVVATTVALFLGPLVGRLVAWIGARGRAAWEPRLVETVHGPLGLLLSALLIRWALAPLRLPATTLQVVEPCARMIVIGLAGALVWRLVRFLAVLGEDAFAARAGDENRVRGFRTQMQLVRQVLSFGVVLVTGALMLMQFEVVRTVGVSLLASAGLATLVIGMGANKTMGTLLAGIQLSITQPVRMGDTVIVEGEWGTIEEITFTYVVVRVWDLRRLVVPVSRFLDASFQNWTLMTPDIMGTVEVFADYAVPVGTVREALQQFVAGQAAWDGKVCGLQVTDVTERSVKLRALVSSADAGKNWDLRCDVREHLIGVLQGLEGGRFLPQARLATADAASGRLLAHNGS